MTAPVRAEWVHVAAPGQLGADTDRGVARATAEAWDAGAASLSDWRGNLVRLAVTASSVSLRPPTIVRGAVVVVDPSRAPYASADHSRAAAALCRTVAILADDHGTQEPIITRAGLAAQNLSDAGDVGAPTPTQFLLTDAFVFLAGAASPMVGLGPLAAAGFVSYSMGARFADAAASEDARALDKKDDAAELLRLTAIYETVVRAHRAAEVRAGHSLAWTAAEKTILLQVEGIQRIVATRAKRHALEPKPLDPWSFLRTLADGAATALEIFAAVAAVGAGLWLYSETR